ncbi:MAG: ESPR-type extended signal peptide-containing protein [Sulfuritalea sp.]|nr:ESPR-type extended signal peptide-containing protein [Sulfuritalea sp.]MDP1981622.1 ESPR-type extended signal peptide-containing protein [Sulfuritalea sp.]
MRTNVPRHAAYGMKPNYPKIHPMNHAYRPVFNAALGTWVGRGSDFCPDRF